MSGRSGRTKDSVWTETREAVQTWKQQEKIQEKRTTRMRGTRNRNKLNYNGSQGWVGLYALGLGAREAQDCQRVISGASEALDLSASHMTCVMGREGDVTGFP